MTACTNCTALRQYPIELDTDCYGCQGKIDLTIFYTYAPGYSGAIGPGGQQVEPDCDPEISVVRGTPDYIFKLLTNEQVDAIVDEIAAAHELEGE